MKGIKCAQKGLNWTILVKSDKNRFDLAETRKIGSENVQNCLCLLFIIIVQNEGHLQKLFVYVCPIYKQTKKDQKGPNVPKSVQKLDHKYV